MSRSTTVTVALLLTTSAPAGDSFVNWESPHTNPIDLTPDDARLLVVNSADNRLEVFAVVSQSLTHVGSVPVGLDPVSVRARADDEAWVVNHISDSISIVDLNAMQVTGTVLLGDEPADVVFAGSPERAFVSVSQQNQLWVFDPADLSAPPTVIPIDGEDPRALATDGTKVYAAIFESGNNTTILGETVVSSTVNPYTGDPNPPPNDGVGFDPPIDPLLPAPPEASLIVQKQPDGTWRDDNNGNWSTAVTWDLHDHDVAVIDAGTLSVTYVTGVMNANMNLGVRPGGEVVVIGTEALNHIRFEPNLQGTFLRVQGAAIADGGTTPSAIVDLNPHLDYLTPTVAQPTRDQSVGDPRGIDWSASRSRWFVCGMGSSNLIALDAGLARQASVDVGEGPTGLVVNDAQDVVYVLNRFSGSVSVVSASSVSVLETVPFFDPTPDTIRAGRRFLYDTHRTSGLGHVACASCHIDGRMDQLAWDLGDPSGAVKPFNQVCNFGVGGCEDWHPMKGPMTTQTLIGIINTEPFHWRGDREDLAAFNGAFVSLMGDDAELTPEDMADFVSFVATLTPPPNPFRDLDHTLVTSLGAGNPLVGETIYNTMPIDGGVLTCVACHALPSGTNGQLTSALALQESQSMKIPQLRNLYEKTGFDATASDNNRGFGFTHDGSTDTLFNFLQFPGFNFAAGAVGDQQRRDLEAFLMSFATDTHAGVGAQVTLDGSGSTTRRDDLKAIAETGAVGMTARGTIAGERRGLVYLGTDVWQSDRAAQSLTTSDLDAATSVGTEFTYTLVPSGSEERIGIDRDSDGYFDRDELDACADPADPFDFPGSDPCPADLAGDDGVVNVLDLLQVLASWGTVGPADLNCDGTTNVLDLIVLLENWGPCT